MVTLADIPQFRVERLTASAIVGLMDRPPVAPDGDAWLYVPAGSCVAGTLEISSTDNLHVVLVTPTASLSPEIRIGAVFPLLPGRWQPVLIDAVLDPGIEWVRVMFQPSDTLRIQNRLQTPPLTGDVEVGQVVPPGFQVIGEVRGGWSKERCTICDRVIGRGGEQSAYRNRRDATEGLNSRGFWFCEADYEAFVRPHNLAFVLE